MPAVYQVNIAVGALGAAVVRVLGSRTMAMAVLVTLPVTLFRTWLLRHGMERDVSASSVVGRALARMALSIAACIVGALLGTEALLGVLIGLCTELVAYAAYAMRLVRSEDIQ